MPETWTIQKVLAWTTERFTQRGIDAPRLTADLLLSAVLGCDRVKLYTDFDRPLEAPELAAYRRLIADRLAGTPTHYLLGDREFFGRKCAVDSRVLIPRPETEQVVETALALTPSGSEGPVLELCTGSGCIAVSLAAERPALSVLATDVSRDALDVARKNAERHGVASRVSLVESDLFEKLRGRVFELIVANPPYVPSAAIAALSQEVLREPRLALDGGPDGLAVLRRIVAEAPEYLSRGGALVLEIGDDQGHEVLELLARSGLAEPEVRKDFAGLARVASARLR